MFQRFEVRIRASRQSLLEDEVQDPIVHILSRRTAETKLAERHAQMKWQASGLMPWHGRPARGRRPPQRFVNET
jgi:hypothetical protein